MINTWFTSDTHFGHTKILEYEKVARPFATVEEMNELLVDRWNSVVKPSDIIFHLGDFCFGKKNLEIAEKLNGKKRLVLGNHDAYSASDYLRYFDKLFGVTFYKMCILSHVPVHPSCLGSRALLNVHGHLHSKLMMEPVISKETCNIIDHIADRRYFNVSVEQNNLTPIHADEILLRLRELQ